MVLQGLTVSNLFKSGSREWDEDTIENLFEERDRKAIYDIVVSRRCFEDIRFWSFEHDGLYSVKSAYKYLQVSFGRWGVITGVNAWRKLWKLTMPGKVKVFIWRMLNNCLPTKCNLQTKMVQVDDLCPQCGLEKETILHCFIECLFAKNCWSMVCPAVHFDNFANMSSWWSYILEHLTDKIELISMVCWSLWRARNELVWNDRMSRASNVVSNAAAYLTQWKGVQTLGKIIPPRPVLETGTLDRWTKPENGCVKINCDATLFRNSGQYGVGWIARDDCGELIYANRVSNKGRPEIQLAEAVAIREALSWIKSEFVNISMRTGISRRCSFVVESDCMIVVKALLKREKIFAPYGSIIDECKCIIESSNIIKVVFVKRSGNKAADWLACSSSSNPGCIIRGESVPSALQCILDADLI